MIFFVFFVRVFHLAQFLNGVNERLTSVLRNETGPVALSQRNQPHSCYCVTVSSHLLGETFESAHHAGGMHTDGLL